VNDTLLSRSIENPPYWRSAIDYLSDRDDILGKIITRYSGEEGLTNYRDPFRTLVRAVIGQQISVKAADSVWFKLVARVETLSPETLLAVPEEDLRARSLSRQKISYLVAISEAFLNGTYTPDRWAVMSDDEVRLQLIRARGVGNWTAEMFLIFHLNRPDIFPLGDLGLINAIQRAYAGDGSLKLDEIRQLGERWRPYRTVATWFLWRSLDPATIQY
jgi:DNA-3-methyladenine glycosylase II